MKRISPLSKPLQKLIKERVMKRRMREKLQLTLLRDSELHWEQIGQKLEPICPPEVMGKYASCGHSYIAFVCKQCGTRHQFPTQCCKKWCPKCNQRIANRRRAKLEIWAGMIAQPKHVVLTMRNFPVLTRKKIRQFTARLAQLRRTKVWSAVRGGSASVEITNEGNGWHLHAHCLLDVDWIDSKELAMTWGGIVEQEFGIVHVRDCRDTSYLSEVTKYVVKGSELAKWPAEQILEFVCAIRKLRFFFQFGSLLKRRKEIAAKLLLLDEGKLTCECGYRDWQFTSEISELLAEIKRES